MGEPAMRIVIGLMLGLLTTIASAADHLLWGRMRHADFGPCTHSLSIPRRVGRGRALPRRRPHDRRRRRQLPDPESRPDLLDRIRSEQQVETLAICFDPALVERIPPHPRPGPRRRSGYRCRSGRSSASCARAIRASLRSSFSLTLRNRNSATTHATAAWPCSNPGARFALKPTASPRSP
jgi:hypothetical protein